MIRHAMDHRCHAVRINTPALLKGEDSPPIAISANLVPDIVQSQCALAAFAGASWKVAQFLSGPRPRGAGLSALL